MQIKAYLLPREMLIINTGKQREALTEVSRAIGMKVPEEHACGWLAFVFMVGAAGHVQMKSFLKTVKHLIVCNY